jgi:hypothetical protein
MLTDGESPWPESHQAAIVEEYRSLALAHLSLFTTYCGTVT